MITDDDKRSKYVKRWHYLAVKNLPVLLKGISSSNNGDFYCLNLKNMREYAINMITVT